MARPSRRALLSTLGAGALAAGLTRWLLPRTQFPGPVLPWTSLSAGAQALVRQALGGLDLERVWDLHAHLVGLGTDGSGAAVDPKMRSHLHPWRRLQFDMYLAGAGVSDLDRADASYLERLLALHRSANPAGRLMLLAFDWHVLEDGAPDPSRSPFHMPNQRVLELARQHRDLEACASIHPYRHDALERLEAAAAAGARAIKWLPNAMGIDPASPRCDAFYRRLAELGLVLLTHGGLEKAVHAEEAQELGNPLRLRRALEHGVRVVVAHCASSGTARDLDDPAGSSRECFELFLRLMGEGTEGQLFGDISALTLVNRCGPNLGTLLTSSDLHPRLVNGSDYPLPAIDLMINLRLLEHRGYLDPADRDPLGEVFDANPLLFDLVLKRRLRVRRDGRELAFAPAVFESARLFD